MRLQRLRPAYSEDELARLYARPHDHTRWPDHHLRVDATLAVARWMARDGIGSAADLSCGNGHILRSLDARRKYFGDYAPGYSITGPIDKTIHEIPTVDLFVCSETIEHLDDPDMVLIGIRAKARMLVLSTPVEAWDDANPEHYWAWDRERVESMVRAAGWLPHVYTAVDFRPQGLPYCFGIWGLL